MSSRKSPFSIAGSSFLAIAFVFGMAIGALTDSFRVSDLETSIIQHSPFVQSLVSPAVSDHVGEIMAYSLYDGRIVDERVGDDTDINPSDLPVVETPAVPVPSDEKAQNPAPQFDYRVSCDVTPVGKPVYKATLVTEHQTFSAQMGGVLRVTLVYKNDGNVPWFSEVSRCKNGEQTPVIQLGTTRDFDRPSMMAILNQPSGWVDANRVAMTSPRVDPGTNATFTFDVQLPAHADIYREYFSLVMPGISWIKDSESFVDFTVGDFAGGGLSGGGLNSGAPYDEETLAKKYLYFNRSGAGSEIDLTAPKQVIVDLSEQRARVMLGDYAVREFMVSSGSPKHPTPVGSWKILYKQQWRIGGAAPYYIMPKWQAWRPDGYGFHALPSLGNAALRARIRALGPDTEVPVDWFKGDGFWSEASSHIGSPRSHGCIRFLPDDAAFVYDFTDVGTPVIVQG